MQGSLNLKTYAVPDDPVEAKKLCEEVIGDIGKLHEEHRQQIAWLKQKFQMVLKKVRPDFVIEDTLRELFDESEMTVDPDVDTEVSENDSVPKGKKKNVRRRKRRFQTISHEPSSITT